MFIIWGLGLFLVLLFVYLFVFPSWDIAVVCDLLGLVPIILLTNVSLFRKLDPTALYMLHVS